ncbi:MAG: VanW family protein [Sporomusaceae bacterium]|nr:VanW family protein [Sporomusaceae bacterium]
MNLPNLQLRNKYVMTLVPLLLVSVGLAFAVYPLFYEQVYAGVMLEDRIVAGKTQPELTEFLADWDEQIRLKTVYVDDGEQRYSVSADAIDLGIDVGATARNVWAYGRSGSWWQRIQSIRNAERYAQQLPLQLSLNEEKLDVIIAGWKQQLDQPPTNATLSLATGGIVPESKGRRLLDSDLKQLLLQAFCRDGDLRLAMPLTDVEPSVTADSLRRAGIVVMQSIFSTRFNTGDVKRSVNVKLAADKINSQILQPGEVFSFNEIVGPRDTASGFQEALEFFDGELVPGIGGGICQVSSTVYNAVLLANLDIKERLNHGKPLSYIGLGRDATVAYGIIDFKFVNSSDSPIMLRTEVKGDTIYAAVFGREKLKETVEITVSDQKEIPPAIVKKSDPHLPFGTIKAENEGSPGYELKVYRLIHKDGKLVKREFLSKDQYMPDNIVVRVGVKPAPAAPGKGRK